MAQSESAERDERHVVLLLSGVVSSVIVLRVHTARAPRKNLTAMSAPQPFDGARRAGRAAAGCCGTLQAEAQRDSQGAVILRAHGIKRVTWQLPADHRESAANPLASAGEAIETR